MRTMTFTALTSIAIVLSTTLACVRETKTIETREAAPKIEQSFERPEATSNNSITIKKSALGKTFMMLISMKTSGPTSQWEDLRPSLVSFEQKNEKILMFEVFDLVYSEIKPEALLGSFPIVSQTNDDVKFHIGEGIKSFPFRASYDDMVSPEKLAAMHPGMSDQVQIKQAQTKLIEMRQNQIIVEQYLRLEVTSTLEKKTKSNRKLQKRDVPHITEQSYLMHLSLRPYVKNEKFKPVKADDEMRIGYFVNLVKGGRKDEKLISKWDLSPEKGPITYVISANTPALYQQPIKEGILYWNRYFGREVLQARVADVVSAVPEDRTVIVRWIPWKDAGFAYGMIQSDPLSGEILRGQIFFTSAFSDDYAGNMPTPAKSNRPRFSLSTNLSSAAITCDHHRAGPTTPTDDVDPQVKAGAIADTVRSVMAHEVGHTLGLRHNFAASFDAKVSAEQVRTAYEMYKKDPKAPGLMTASSVMDYPSKRADYLLGKHISTSEARLSYDEAAIRFGYFDGPITAGSPLYCTDEFLMLKSTDNVSVYACEARDDGQNPFLSALQSDLEQSEKILESILESQAEALYEQEPALDLNNIEAVTNALKLVTFPMLQNQEISQLLTQSLMFRQYQNENLYQTVTIDTAKSHFRGSQPHETLISAGDMDSQLMSQLGPALQESGGLVGIFAKATMIDPKTGRPDLGAIDRFVGRIYTERARTRISKKGTAYTISESAFAAMRNATLQYLAGPMTVQRAAEIFLSKEVQKEGESDRTFNTTYHRGVDPAALRDLQTLAAAVLVLPGPSKRISGTHISVATSLHNSQVVETVSKFFANGLKHPAGLLKRADLAKEVIETRRKLLLQNIKLVHPTMPDLSTSSEIRAELMKQFAGANAALISNFFIEYAYDEIRALEHLEAALKD